MEKLAATLIAPPAQGLITRDQAKAHIRRDDDDDNDVIDAMIDLVSQHLDGIDGILGRALLNQTWEEQFAGFPMGPMLCLRLAPLAHVVSITYFDADNVERTLSSGLYSGHNATRTAFIQLASGQSWPETRGRVDAVRVRYVAGYGADPDAVPAPIRHAARLLLGHFYENREATFFGTIGATLPIGAMNLLRPFIRPKF